MRSFTIYVMTILLFACAHKPKQSEPAVRYDPVLLQQFVVAVSGAHPDKAKLLIDSALSTAAQDSSSYMLVTNSLEKSFGDPNSRYRNEDVFIHLLQEKIRSPWCDSLQKYRYRNQLYLRMQNRPGAAANDFEYVTPAGIKKRMYGIESDFTLLLFYNPECEACKEMKTALMNSVVINEKINSKQLKILAIYTDKDEKIWLDHLPEMPESWMQGRDVDEYLYKNNIYDLHAIPTVYLLDRDKKVLLKDCLDVPLIEQELRH